METMMDEAFLKVYCDVMADVILPERRSLGNRKMTKYWRGWYDSLLYYEMRKRVPALPQDEFDSTWSRVIKDIRERASRAREEHE
jgi:hypothetical protein